MLTSTLVASAILMAPQAKPAKESKPPLPTKPIEVPFKITETAIIAKAKVNGKEVECMFDTGYSGAFAVHDKIDLGKPTGQAGIRDFVGTMQVDQIPVKSLEMGGVKIDGKDMLIIQTPGDSSTFSYNTHAIGIMGLEVMRDFVLEINMQKSMFILHPKSFDFTKRVPDNKKTFMPKFLMKGGNSVELAVKTKNGGKLTLALDTGNGFYATTHRDKLENLGIWPVGQRPNFMTQAFVASGAVESWYMFMHDMEIFGVPVKRSVWSIIDAPSSSAEHDGTVGFGFLKNFNTIIDLPRRRVWLEHFTNKVSDEPVAELGMSGWFYPEEGRYFVTRVIGGSPAAKAGIQRGDALLAIDGNELNNLGPYGLPPLLEGPLGKEIAVTTSRNGQVMRNTLKTAYLINGTPEPK